MSPVDPPLSGEGRKAAPFTEEELAQAVPASIEMPAELAFRVSLFLLGDPVMLCAIKGALTEGPGAALPMWTGEATNGATVVFQVVEQAQPGNPAPWSLSVSVLPPEAEDGTFPVGLTWTGVPPVSIVSDIIMRVLDKMYVISSRPAPYAPLERARRSTGAHSPGERHPPGTYCPACSAVPGLFEVAPKGWLGGAQVFAGVKAPGSEEILMLRVRVGRAEEQAGLVRAWWARNVRGPLPPDPLVFLDQAGAVMAETTEAAGPYGARCPVLVLRSNISLYVGHPLDLVEPISE